MYSQLFQIVGDRPGDLRLCPGSTRDLDVTGQRCELERRPAAQIYRRRRAGAKNDRPELGKGSPPCAGEGVFGVTGSTASALDAGPAQHLDAVGSSAASNPPRLTWAERPTPQGRLMLAVWGGLAEFERELITAVHSDGRAVRRRRGVSSAVRPS